MLHKTLLLNWIMQLMTCFWLQVIRALKQQSRIGAEFPPKEVRIDESSG